jgi:hypothetical protein
LPGIYQKAGLLVAAWNGELNGCACPFFWHYGDVASEVFHYLFAGGESYT